jgi:hypothetical protein
LEECIKEWLQDKTIRLYVGLPSIPITNLWWAHNTSIFKDKYIPPEITTNITLNLAEEFKEKNPCILVMPSINYEVPWGYFDVMCQGHPPSCGVGAVLYINNNNYIYIRYAPRTGTNNRAEFITLWTLPKTTIKKDVNKLQVMETQSWS